MRPGGWSRARWSGLASALVLLTALVLAALTRPVAPAGRGGPTVPSTVSSAALGRPADSQVRTERPDTLWLPSGVSMQVDVVATVGNGVLGLPSDVDRAGWWDGGSRIGDPFGAIVLAAHVDSISKGVGPFAELLGARPGQRIRVAGSGSDQTFEIVSVRLAPRASLSADTALFSVHQPLRLILITCAGPFDADRGGYRDNLIVAADPVGHLRSTD
ncbi:MAG: peptidase sortase [Aeromicrobium sp.]|nr:peptidase sortase [Aeromicrobium sp.]